MCKHKTKLVKCPHCTFESCIPCITTYLMESIHLPHCQSCRHEWPEIISKLSKEYKIKMEQTIFAREQTYLAHLQPIVVFENKMDELRRLKTENQLNEDQLVSTQRAKERALNLSLIHTQPLSPKLPVAFCPVEKCRGFISDFQCGLCFVKVCQLCIRVHEDEENACIPCETKQCPHCDSCVYQTSKDTTFCLHCHQGFSWLKGAEPAIHTTEIQSIHLSTSIKLGLLGGTFYRDYVKVLKCHRNICTLRVMMTNYEKNLKKELETERLFYLKGGHDIIFIQKFYQFQMSYYKRHCEQAIITHFILVGEDILAILNTLTTPPNTNPQIAELVQKLDDLSIQSMIQLKKLDKIYPHTGKIDLYNIKL